MSILGLVDLALQLYFYAVFVWVILSWIRVSSVHPLGRIQAFLDRIIYPVILRIRRVLPPIRIGAGALDLSPIVLLLAIQLLRSFI